MYCVLRDVDAWLVADHICQDVSVAVSHWICCSQFKEYEIYAVVFFPFYVTFGFLHETILKLKIFYIQEPRGHMLTWSQLYFGHCFVRCCHM